MTFSPRRAAVTLTAGAMLLSLTACSREEAPANDVAMTNELVANNAGADNAMMAGNEAAGAGQAASFAGGDGAALGSASVAEGAGGLTIDIVATGMPVGTHGIHLHEKGQCEGPKFESAGAHWNPGMKKHGRDNPDGAHLGDLANLEIGADGQARTSVTITGATMASGSAMLADADGTALVVHAKADDYKTDPSGNSGDRIACAVLAPPR